MEFTAGGARTVEEAKVYADFSIHRLTVAIRSRTITDMRDEVARLGDELVSRTVDL
ncbi:putative Alkanesulfonate monooxygenase domain protein [Mycobacterium xenopi 4042]|uniref:Putative Alkanesulfonate monooxygenase domain protein n=1 Tax=Mycobacterium xenopi 4042 TaxID=1299334 RepID=X7ZV97_MYCXE|nr:putative Alkanesulfonate monooxygenase domain protein [Mycobacterium xenopi 4042]